MKASSRPSQRPLLSDAVPAVLACFGLLGGSALAAAPPHSQLEKLLACRNITSAAARLQCFDRTSAALALAITTTGTAAPSAGTAVAASASNPPKATEATSSPGRDLDPRQTFGLSSGAILAREIHSGVRRKSISSITARVTGVGVAPDGRVIYSLDDGQTWRELVADGEAPPVKSGDQVRISRGWLDSYWLETASGRGCKVERLH